jgi:hypothetical protein
MSSVVVAAKAPVLVPFVCPICAGPNAVNLIALSRAGGVNCAKCSKHLRSSDVMRAMHAPRKQA